MTSIKLKNKSKRKNEFNFYSYIAAILITIVVICALILFCKNNNFSAADNGIVAYNDNWYFEEENGKQFITEETKSIETAPNETLTISKVLGNEVLRGSAIGFYTAHQEVKVCIDGELIYEYSIKDSLFGKTPGNNWNVVSIDAEDIGKVLSIELTSSYSSNSGTIPRIMFGGEGNILKKIVLDGLSPFIICIIMFIIGAILVACYLIFRNKMNLSIELFWLGAFAIELSIWAGMETQLINIFCKNNIIVSQITFMSLILVQIPIVRFIAEVYELKNRLIIDFLSYLGLGTFLAEIVLQIFNIADFRQTLILTHIVFAISLAVVFILTVNVLIKRTVKDNKKITAHIICICIIAVSVAIDLCRYYFENAVDSSKFGRIALLIYIIVLAVYLLRDSVYLIRSGREVETIRQIASKDALTRLSNRMAFDEGMESISSKEYSRYGIGMFDLNNLKYVNDNHGHAKGDYYLVLCAETIDNMFSGKGHVYRIGGDEFCLIAKNLSVEEFERCKIKMRQELETINTQVFEGKMAIACGYVKYDINIDRNLQNTLERADDLMYKNKRELKREEDKRRLK